MSIREDSLKKMYLFQDYLGQMQDDWNEFYRLNYEIRRKLDQQHSLLLPLVGILDGVVALAGLVALFVRYAPEKDVLSFGPKLTEFYERYLSVDCLPWVCLAFAGIHFLATYIHERIRAKKLSDEVQELNKQVQKITNELWKHYSLYKDPPVVFKYANPDVVGVAIRYLNNTENDECTVDEAVDAARGYIRMLNEGF